MKTEKNHLINNPLSEQNERQLLLYIASKNKQQAEEAFQEFIKRHKDRLYEFCLNETADYTEDHKKNLAKSVYGSLLINIFDYPEDLLEVIKGKRSSLSMQAAIFSHLESVIIPEIFQKVLKDQWLDKEVYVWLPPKKIDNITDQNAFHDYTNLKHALPELHQDTVALKTLKKVIKTFKPRDQKFLIMNADPILHKNKQFPEITALTCQEFDLTEYNYKQRKSRLFKRLKTKYKAEKEKN